MKRFALSLVMALALGVAAPLAPAQDLGPEIVRSQSLDAAQSTAIGDHVGRALELIQSGEPLKIKQGRERLLAPLRDRSASVSFRQAYSAAAIPRLAPLLDQASDFLATNVLIIAGEMATTDAAALAESKLADERAPVRVAAVSAFGRTFNAVSAASPAITADATASLVARLGDVVTREQDWAVFDAATRALITAMSVEREGFSSVRATALSTLTRSLSERVKALASAGPLSEKMFQTLIRVGEATRNLLTQANPALAPSDEGLKQIAELHGHMLALVVRRQRAGDFPDGDTAAREIPAQLVSVAETAIGIAAQRANARGETPRGLADDFRQATSAGDREFFRKSIDLLKILQQPPLSFPVGHFLAE